MGKIIKFIDRLLELPEQIKSLEYEIDVLDMKIIEMQNPYELNIGQKLARCAVNNCTYLVIDRRYEKSKKRKYTMLGWRYVDRYCYTGNKIYTLINMNTGEKEDVLECQLKSEGFFPVTDN